MADSVKLTVQLVDRVSGPSRKAAAGLDNISGGLRKVEKTGTAVASKVGAAFVKMAAVIGTVVVAAVAAAGRAMVKAAAEAEQFRFGLKAFLGSGKKADAEMQALLRISDKLGISFKNTVSTFQSFVSAGLSPKGAKDMIKWRADLEALAAGVPSKMAAVGSAFEQLEKAIVSGKIEADAFQTVLKGIPGADKLKVLTRVAKLLGKSGKDAAKFIKEAGKNMSKLPVPETIKAFKQLFLEGANAQKLGALATAKQLSTFSGAFAAFKNRANNTLTRIGIGVGPSLKSAFLPALKAMGAALGKVDLGKVIGRIKAGIEAAAPAIKAFASGLGKGLAKSIVIASKLAKAFGKMFGAFDAKSVSMVGQMIGATLAAVGVMATAVAVPIMAIVKVFGSTVAAIKSVVQWFKTLFTAPAQAIGAIGSFFANLGTSIATAVASLGAAALGIGKSIVSGIVKGISSGASSVVSSIVSVAKSAIGAAKKVLGISSPSKVFGYFGEMSALGFAKGMESVNAVPSLQGSAQLAPGLGGGGATVNQTNVFETSVNEAASAAATASEIKKQQLLQMAAAFERAALELGVGTV